MLSIIRLEPCSVENTPDVKEKEEIVNVEFTVKLSAVICALESVENTDVVP